MGDRFPDRSLLEYIPSDNGEAVMPESHGQRIAREGGDIVSSIQALLHQTSTGAVGGSNHQDGVLIHSSPPCLPCR